MSEIEALTAAARKLLDQDAADIAGVAQIGPYAGRLATMQGTTVLMSGTRAHGDLVARRALLEEALSWEHRTDARYNDCTPEPAGGCYCGRDDQVLTVLRFLLNPADHVILDAYGPTPKETP